MRRWTRYLAGSLSVVIATLTVLSAVAAADYPTRSVEIVVPFGPGSNTDRLLLALAPHLERELGQKVLPNYKSGGGGTIGTAWLARAKPDGYNLAIMPPGPILVKPRTSNLPYALRDFVPIAQVGVYYTAIVVPEKSKWKTVQEFIADAKANPGKYTFATSGPFSLGQLTMVAIAHATGIDVKHVPFEGGGKVLLAVLGGQVDLAVTEVRPDYGKDGKTRLLTVVTGARLPEQPDVPIFKELGYDLVFDIWMALIAPKGTPPAVIDRLEAAARKVTAAPDFQEAVKSQTGATVSFLGSKDLAAKWERETKLMGDVLKALGVLRQ